MELEFKVSGVKPATTPTGARRNLEDWRREESERLTLEHKAEAGAPLSEGEALRLRLEATRRRLAQRGVL